MSEATPDATTQNSEHQVSDGAVNNVAGGALAGENGDSASTRKKNGAHLDSLQKASEKRYDLSSKGKNVAGVGVEEELLKPLWFANKIVDHPCAVCCGCLVIVLILAFVDALVFELSDETDRTWLVEDSRETQDYDTWTLANDALSEAGGDDVYTTPQTQQESSWTIQFMFELNNYDEKIDTNNPDKTDYWILTPEYLQTILKYEEMVTQDEEWINSFCYVVNTTTFECDYDSLARDVAVHFDYDFGSMTTESIRAYVWELYTSSDSPGTIESMFNEEFGATNQTYVYRSFLRSAMPIATSTTYFCSDGSNSTSSCSDGTEVIRIEKASKYRNDGDKEEDQEDDYHDWIEDYFQDITVDHEADKRENGLRIVFFEATIFNEEFNTLLMQSMGWVLAAIVAVLFWVTVHLQSFLLAITALLQINLSFPAAYFIYRFVFQIDHFDTLSTLIIFVLLGVGADDVFVFTDAWRQSIIFVDDSSDLKQRMSFAYRRAAKAMLVTQTTTFCAFLATSASNIMPISAFGLWAASIVFCNYLLVITMYPALLIVHHKYIKSWEEKYCCCCCNKCTCGDKKEDKEHQKEAKNATNEEKEQISPKKKKNKGEQVELTTNGTSVKTQQKQTSNKTGGDGDDSDDDDDDEALPPAVVRRQSTVDELAAQYGPLEAFFAQTWSAWIQKSKWGILLLFAVLFGLAVWRASELEEQNEEEEWFEDGHYMSETLDFFDEFASSEETDLVYITVLFGAKGVNRDGTDQWDAEDYGKIKWDSSFDLSSVDAQNYLYQACQDLSQSDLVFQATSVSCPIVDFESYLNSIGETFPYVASDDDTELQFDMFAEMMYNFTQSSYATVANQDKLIYVEAPEERSDNKAFVRYVALGVYSSLRVDADLDEQRDDKDEWYDWRKDVFTRNDDCPDGIKRPIVSSLTFCWMITNEEFIFSAFQGIAIALPLAFVVLMISTQNWIMSIFATFDIIGVMACELAVMNVAGWKFGVSESVAIVIIIGFSVDYVVHLANAYLESNGGVRSERVSFALLTMGISVVSGAMTTFLGGIFLTFPELTFFVKMGILIMTTIAFSLAWSMLFFIALLAAFGPEYERGNMPWCHKAANFVCRKNDSEDEA